MMLLLPNCLKVLKSTFAGICSIHLKILLTVPDANLRALVLLCLSPQELVRLCSAQESELHGTRECGELPGAHGGPLPSLPAGLPATSDVSIRGAKGKG